MPKVYILIVAGCGYISNGRLIQALKLEEMVITTENSPLGDETFFIPRSESKKGKKRNRWPVVRKLGPGNRGRL